MIIPVYYVCHLFSLFESWNFEQRPNSLTKCSRQKSQEFSSLLFKATSTALPWLFYFSNSHILLQFLQCYCTNVQDKGGKPDRKPHPLPNGSGNPYPCRNLKSWELSRLCLETSRKLCVHEFGFWCHCDIHCKMSSELFSWVKNVFWFYESGYSCLYRGTEPL